MRARGARAAAVRFAAWMSFALPSAHRCTVPVEAADLPPHIFQHRYRAASQPVVIRNATLRSAADFRAKTTIAALVEAVGDAVVTLSSANAYSYGREKMSVQKVFRACAGTRGTSGVGGSGGRRARRRISFIGLESTARR